MPDLIWPDQKLKHFPCLKLFVILCLWFDLKQKTGYKTCKANNYTFFDFQARFLPIIPLRNWPTLPITLFLIFIYVSRILNWLIIFTYVLKELEKYIFINKFNNINRYKIIICRLGANRIKNYKKNLTALYSRYSKI